MTKDKSDINILQAIICDDIRREDNGKFLLIGVYPGGIFMNSMPSEILLSLWVQFEIDLKEKVTLEFAINGDSLQEPVNFSTPLEDTKLIGKKQTLPFIGKFSLKIKTTGDFSIHYRKLGDKNWNLIANMPVYKNR